MKRQRVLVVDDMEEVYRKIEGPLRETYDLHYARSVSEGRTEIESGKYDKVLTDFEIGDKHPTGGLDIIAAAKEKGIPVVGMSMRNHEQEVVDAGARFLFKKELFGILQSDRNLNSVFLQSQ